MSADKDRAELHDRIDSLTLVGSCAWDDAEQLAQTIINDPTLPVQISGELCTWMPMRLQEPAAASR